MKIIVMLILIMCPALSYASEKITMMRCNSNIVSINDNFQDVRNKCGEPTSFADGLWIYDFGANEFTYILYFHRGLVTKIVNTGNYGKKNK